MSPRMSVGDGWLALSASSARGKHLSQTQLQDVKADTSARTTSNKHPTDTTVASIFLFCKVGDKVDDLLFTSLKEHNAAKRKKAQSKKLRDTKISAFFAKILNPNLLTLILPRTHGML